MTGEGILMFVLVLATAFLVFCCMRLYWKMRSDNGYNMGRNHMLDMGFTDDDIQKGQDDADREMYVFRKPNEKEAHTDETK